MPKQHITRDEFNTQKEAVLSGFQISSRPTLKSISALFFSGLISTFGIYSILLSMKIEGNNLYKAIGIFIIILIVADTFKRGALANYLNSVTRNNILGNVKTRKMQLIISGLALSFMLVFDVVGSVSTANYTEQSYQDFRATNSKEFELLESKAEQGKSTNSNYTLELTTWKESKSEEVTRCATRNITQKYRTICLDKWKEKNPMPVNPKADTTVNISDFKELKSESNEDFLSNYMFYIIFFLAMALTMLLQYTTLSEILESHEDIRETLTPEVVGILQDRISELETNMIMHETERNELISDSDREEKTHKRQFEKLGKAIQLLGISKAVDARGDTVQRIANNHYVPQQESKAGYVKNPFSSQPQPKVKAVSQYLIFLRLFDYEESPLKVEASGVRLKPTEKVIAVNHKGESEALYTLYNTLIDLGIIELREDGRYYSLMGFTEADKIFAPYWYENKKPKSKKATPKQVSQILKKLWGNAGAGDKLTPKTKVININKRSEVELMGKIYKQLIKQNYAELRGNGGYFALVPFDDVALVPSEIFGVK